MKNWITGIVVVIFLLAVGCLIGYLLTKGSAILPPTDNAELIRQLEDNIAASVAREDSLALQDSLKGLKIDSLKTVIASIIKKYEIKRREIDLEIAKDSLNAVKVYRFQLLELGEMPWSLSDGASLSLWEIGTGAKYLSGIPGMQLTINKYQENELNYVERLKIKDQRLSEKDFQLAGKDDLIKMHKANEEYYKKQFDNTEKFFYHRFGFYVGVGGNYDGKTISPGIQLGVGIFIWRNE